MGAARSILIASLLASQGLAGGRSALALGSQPRPFPSRSGYLATGGGASSKPTQPPSAAPTRPADDAAILRDGSAERPLRAAAADRLLQSDDPDARRLVSAVLTPSAQPPDAAAITLAEIAGLSTAPGWLLEPLTALLQSAPADQGPGILAALASIRTRDAVRTILSQTTPTTPNATRDAAFAALARLTGRNDIGPDVAGWTDWFSSVEFLPEPEWQRTLAAALADAADRAHRDREQAITRLVDANLQRYLEAPQGEPRWTVLAALLHDEIPRVRRQGVTLVKTELANARIPGKAVADATVDLLRDPLPDLRRAGAELADSLHPPGAERGLLDALLTETDDSVASLLLKAACRYPSQSLRPVILQWVAKPASARRAALDAAAALLDRQLLTADDDRAAVLTALRSIDPASLPPSGLRLLVALGNTEDRNAVAALLTSTAPATRLAAAEALGASAPALDDLLLAAGADNTLFPAALRALTAHRPTLDGFRQALALPCAAADAQRDSLSTLAAALDPADLLAAAHATSDLGLRARILSRLETVPLRRPLLAGGPSTPQPAVVAGLLLLAQTHLDLGQPAAALAAIDALAPVSADIDPSLRSSLATIALLWLDRLDDAALVAAPAAAWLDGLDRCRSLPHALDIAAAIHARFDSSLTPQEASRLKAIEAQLRSSSPPPRSAPPSPSARAPS